MHPNFETKYIRISIMRKSNNIFPFTLFANLFACGQATLGIEQTKPSLRRRSLCDESLFFPEYTPAASESTPHWPSPDGPRFVAIPNDPTGRSYAPLCPDGRRINLRKMQNCNEGSCWSETYNFCTFECTWNRPTSKPTPFPTVPPTVGLEESTHPVRITFNNVPEGFRLSNVVIGEILHFANKILKDFLEESLELVDVSFVGIMSEASARKGGRRTRLLIQRQRRLEKLFYYLSVTVRAPSDIPEFTAKYYVINTVQEHMGDLLIHLKSLNNEVFLELDVGDLLTDSYDADDLDFTSPPVEEEVEIEMGRDPTQSPTLNLKAKESLPNVDIKTEEEYAVAWWIWLMVALTILLVILCLVAFCLYRRKKEKKENEKHEIRQYFNTIRVAKEPFKSTRRFRSQHHKQHKRMANEIRHSRRRAGPKRERALGVVRTERGREVRKKRRSKRKHEKRVRAYANLHGNFREHYAFPDDCAAIVEPPQETALVLYSPKIADESGCWEPERPALQDSSCIGKIIDVSRESNLRENYAFPAGKIIDVPQENALVLYSPKIVDESGCCAPERPTIHDSSCIGKIINVRTQDPGGRKFPKKFSVYAEDAYSSASSVFGSFRFAGKLSRRTKH